MQLASRQMAAYNAEENLNCESYSTNKTLCAEWNF